MNKSKGKNQRRKPRLPIVGLDFGRDVEISYINIENKQIISKDEQGILLEPTFVSVGDAYLRKSRPKVLRQLQAEPTSIKLDTKQLLRSQDATIIVDTNYRNCGDFRICICSSTIVTYQMESGRRIAYCYPQANLLFYAPCTENPERFGWCDILKRFTDSALYDDKKIYGLVVDSDLGELSSINKRETSVWHQYYLPDGFQLIYASADAGRESYINQVMKKCDKRAGKVLSQVLPNIKVVETRKALGENECLPLCYLRFKDEI